MTPRRKAEGRAGRSNPPDATTFLLALAGWGGETAQSAQPAQTTLLNVSYDVSREFYQAYNPLFASYWKAKTGEEIIIRQSHAGSTKQARAVIDGLEADVVTMNQSLEIDRIQERDLIATNWSGRLPHHSVPYQSTIVFLVRKGNPKGIRDWNDLIRPGISVILPHPKTSGNGRYGYLGAWGYALRQPQGDEASAKAFVKALFAHVPILESGGRSAASAFAQKGQGDVLVTFESEVQATLREFGDKPLQVIVPPISILAENPVAWVDTVVQKHGTARQAKAYLEYLFSPSGQELVAQHYFRPILPEVRAKYANRFPEITLFTVQEIAGGWARAQEIHFRDGGIFDQISK